MKGDDRSRSSVAALDLPKINEQLRKLSDQIARIEGRSGGVNVRDSISLKSDKQTLIDFDTTDSGKGSIVAYGTENATLALAKGARKEDNGEWIATDTAATIFAIDRTGNGTLYFNSGLTIGQAFSPSSSYVIGSGGSVAAHALVSATHTAAGLTTGHVLRATSATAFDFGTVDSAYFTGTNWTDLTDAGDSTLHYHAADRNSANFTGTNWTDLTDGGSTTLHKHDFTEGHGGTIYNSAGIPNAALNILAWIAPYACTVTAVKAIKKDGTSVTVNARRNGSSNHVTSFAVSSNDTLTDGGAVSNTAYAAGDWLEIMVTATSGTVTQVIIEVYFTRST